MHELGVELPQAKADRDLTREPRNLEGASGEEMALGLSNMKHGFLDALRDLVLIENYGTIGYWSATCGGWTGGQKLTPLLSLAAIEDGRQNWYVAILQSAKAS